MGINVHKRVAEYVQQWEERCYKNGIPDEAPIEIADKVPSYKRIALALLKNDLQLTSLGYEPKKSKYYSVLKKIEIDARPNTVKQFEFDFKTKKQ